MSSHTISRDARAGRLFDPSAFIALECEELREHAQKCRRSRDWMFWWQCGFEKAHAYVGGRIISLLVVVTIILLAGGAIAGQ